MSTDRLRIELTTEQQEQVNRVLGQHVDAVELKVEELEQRIAPDGYLHLDMQQTTVTAVHWS